MFGDFELTLNDTINIPSNFNYSWINDTNTILSIIPALSRNLDPGFDPSKLMFTW